MKRAIRRFLALTLAGAMSMSLLAGCANSDKEKEEEQKQEESEEEQEESAENQEESAEEDDFEHDPLLNELGADQICKEEITITIGIKQSVKVLDYETNWYTQLLEETGNVNLDFVLFPADGADDKLRMMITGGEELPDIIMWGQSDAQMMVWGEEGYFVPLEDYFEHSSYYAAEGYARVKENGGLDILDYITLSDGHIWTFPQYQETMTNPPYARMFIWQPWLDALGLEIPTNLDEFYDMLVAFKTQDPNGNGIADEIPLISADISAENSTASYAWEYLMNSFVQSTSRSNIWLNSEDGELYAPFTTDEFKEGVKYITKLVQEGLYDPVSFTQDVDTYRTFLKTTGDHLVGVRVEMTWNTVEPTTKSDWRLISTLDGPDGTSSYTYKPDVPTNMAYITADCEHPEVAFRILDLMCREDITITSRWGKQGEHWDYVYDLDEAEMEALMSEKSGTTVEYDWENVTFAGYPCLVFEYDNIWGKEGNVHWQNAAVAFRTGEITSGYYAASTRTDEEFTSTAEGQYGFGQFLEDIADNLPEEPVVKIKYADLDTQMEAESIYADLEEYIYEKLASWFTGVSDVEKDWDSYLEELEKIGLSRYLELAQAGWNVE